MLNLSRHDEGDTTIVVLQGRVDLHGAADLETTLQTIWLEGQSDVLLDVAAVDYISSAGIRALVEALARSRDGGAKFGLVGLNVKVQRLLRILGLDELFLQVSPQAFVQC